MDALYIHVHYSAAIFFSAVILTRVPL